MRIIVWLTLRHLFSLFKVVVTNLILTKPRETDASFLYVRGVAAER